MTDKRTLRALLDVKTLKPGCVILQAAYGGDREVCFMFSDWETSQTKSMKMVTETADAWLRIATLEENRRNNGK